MDFTVVVLSQPLILLFSHNCDGEAAHLFEFTEATSLRCYKLLSAVSPGTSKTYSKAPGHCPSSHVSRTDAPLLLLVPAATKISDRLSVCRLLELARILPRGQADSNLLNPIEKLANFCCGIMF
jgi:hypothetical protein